MSIIINRDLPNDEYNAAVGANNPSASNVFATIADLTSGTAVADKLIFDAKYDEAGGILKGQAVYISGADGTNILVKKADYSTEATSSKTLGLTTEPGALNHQGQVISNGLLSNIDTSAAGAVGDPVWLGDDGNLIYGLANKPYAPNHLVFIGIVTKKNASTGEIFVKVQNGFEFDELHDVDLISNAPTDGQVLSYDAVANLWVPATIPGATPSGTQLLTGGASWSGTGMIFNVSALTYTIDGNYYSSIAQDVTLATGDPSNPRFDAIVVDATGTVSVITGTPSANPIVPSIPGTQVLVQYVLVAAGAVTPSVTNEFVYTDGSTPNWIPGSNLLTVFDPLSTTPAPFQGTECTYITALSASNSRFLKYTKPSGNILRSDFPFLSFRIQVLPGSSGRGMNVRLYNGLTYISYVNAANWGYSSTAVGVWQLIVIPLSAFGNNAITTATEIRFLPQGTVVSATPFAFDDIKFQSGYGPQINTATIDILDSGTVIGSTAKLNFINGTNTTAVVTNDIPNNKVDVQIDNVYGSVGISDSTGTYTYYSTFELALAAAVAGDIITFFNNLTTTSINNILKNGVDINLNGYTLTCTNNTFGPTNTFITDNNVAITVKMFNGTIVRTDGDYLLSVKNTGSKIEFYNVVLTHIVTYAVENYGTLENLKLYSTEGVDNYGLIQNAYIETFGASGIGINNGTNGIVQDTVINAEATGIFSNTGSKVYNSKAYATTNRAIQIFGAAEIYNCVGVSINNSGIFSTGAAKIHNCKGYSENGSGVYASNFTEMVNTEGYSLTNAGLVIDANATSICENVSGFSDTSQGVAIYTNSAVTNVYITNLTSVSKNNYATYILMNSATTKVLISNLQSSSHWTSSNGHSVYVNGTASDGLYISGGALTIVDASAKAIFATATLSMKWGNLTFKIPTGTAPVSATITQAVVNTVDLYGNLIINN